MQRRFYWPRMQQYVTKFVQQCEVYQYYKGTTQNLGLYMPLSVRDSIWEDLIIDFIIGLPKTKRGIDSIIVVVDRFYKMTHFLSCKWTYDARLFFQEIVPLHNIPRITLDHDFKFISTFWRELWKIFQTKINMSSAYNLQTDGQTKIVNRTILSQVVGYSFK